MRTGNWIALTVGVVIMGLGVGLAQEKTAPQHPLAKKAPANSAAWTNAQSEAAPRRAGLTIQGNTKSTQPQRYTRQGKPAAIRITPAPQTKSAQTKSASQIPATDGFSALQPIPSKTKNASRTVIHAEYRANPGANQNRIQQVNDATSGSNTIQRAARPDATPVPIKLIDDTQDRQIDTPVTKPQTTGGPIRVIPEDSAEIDQSVPQVKAIPETTAPIRAIPDTPAAATDKPTVTATQKSTPTRTLPADTAAAPAPPRQPARTARLTIQKPTRSVTPKLPTTGPQSPMVTVEWIKDSDINVGQECALRLMVKNSGRVEASQIEVEAQFPNTIRLISTTPKPAEMNDAIVWKIDRLAPGAAQEIAIRMIPSERGDLATNARVRFTGAASGLFRVEEPLLHLVVDGPEEVLVGEPAAHLITVSNPGTGIARNVKIEALIPSGLEHARGERLLMDIGSLTPGESRRVRLSLVATQGGPQQVQVKVAGDANLTQTVASNTNVIAPSLSLAVKGPGIRYMGRSAEFTLTVTNDGSIPSNNVRTKYKLPDGFRLLRADRGGKYDQVSRTVDWFVGSLDAGKSATMKVHLASEKLGAYTHQAVAVSEHGAQASAQMDTRIEGSASLVLEITDKDDPVEVGAKTEYEIRVRNTGTKAANKVSVSCELTAGVELVSADGPVDFIAENGLLVFKSMPQLAPGKTAVFQVRVRGVDSGNHRFRARLASDSIKEPLIFEELTTFYSE